MATADEPEVALEGLEERPSGDVDCETERALEEEAIPAAAIAAGGGIWVPWPLKAMIPMYIYPTYLGSFWNVIEANPTNVEYVIANVDTGPGRSANSDYTTHVDNCRAVGIKVLGYVDTNYAGIAQSAVEAEMAIWDGLYAVDGFFFDRVPNVIGSEAYYTAVSGYAKSLNPGFITVNNFGTTFAASYMPTAEIHVITENTEANLLANVPSLVGFEFVFSYAPWRFAQVIYDATAGNLYADMAAVAKRHSAYVFVTPDGAYGTQPPYWTEEQTWLGRFGAPEASPVLPGIPQSVERAYGNDRRSARAAARRWTARGKR
jgi:Spherulation-specific family 4